MYSLCFFNMKYPEVEIVEIADTIMYSKHRYIGFFDSCRLLE